MLPFIFLFPTLLSSLVHSVVFKNWLKVGLFFFFAEGCSNVVVSETLDLINFNFVISINLSIKYQRFNSSGCKDIGIGKFKFMAEA